MLMWFLTIAFGGFRLKLKATQFCYLPKSYVVDTDCILCFQSELFQVYFAESSADVGMYRIPYKLLSYLKIRYTNLPS